MPESILRWTFRFHSTRISVLWWRRRFGSRILRGTTRRRSIRRRRRTWLWLQRPVDNSEGRRRRQADSKVEDEIEEKIPKLISRRNGKTAISAITRRSPRHSLSCPSLTMNDSSSSLFSRHFDTFKTNNNNGTSPVPLDSPARNFDTYNQILPILVKLI